MDKYEKRIKTIHQNGNDGEHYGMTAKEARKLSDISRYERMTELEALIIPACEKSHRRITLDRGLSEELSATLRDLGYSVFDMNKGGSFPKIEISW